MTASNIGVSMCVLKSTRQGRWEMKQVKSPTWHLGYKKGSEHVNYYYKWCCSLLCNHSPHHRVQGRKGGMVERTWFESQTSDCCSFGFFPLPDFPRLGLWGEPPRRLGEPFLLSIGSLGLVSSSLLEGPHLPFLCSEAGGERGGEGQADGSPIPMALAGLGSAPGSWAGVGEEGTKREQLRMANGERGAEVERARV